MPYPQRSRAGRSGECPDVLSYKLDDQQARNVIGVVESELKTTVQVYNRLRECDPDVVFKKMLSMNVTEMRRCLKHGRQRLQCNRPHAPLALCEKIIGTTSLGEFGHWLQLMYHLRRFAKGLVKTCNLTTDMQAALVDHTQCMIMLSIAEHNETDVWTYDPAECAYPTAQHKGTCARQNAREIERPASPVTSHEEIQQKCADDESAKGKRKMRARPRLREVVDVDETITNPMTNSNRKRSRTRTKDR